MKIKTSRPVVKPGYQHVTWLTIAIQCAFPVAGAFTPAIAAAQQHFLHASTASSSATDNSAPAQLDPSEAWQLKLAGMAAQAGSAMGDEHHDATASAARGLATSQANAEIQQWLNHFGTARVQLNTDKRFSLKNSQFDLLLPLVDRPDLLFFTQGSFHRTDSRNQGNLGLGVRHFAADYMTGLNAFYDRDFSHQNARAGMGLEYWRDFMKVSINGYLRLTGWKDSKDFADYQERVANGWDIRTEGYLPSLPQLGAKLNFEQYYGSDVALFGKDNRQKNPYAVTAGVTWTPVPLLTLEAEQREGKSGENETKFGLAINYQLGASWQQQTDTSAVAALRRLQGSRYDLVDRNNNIVLEYRKKEVITLKEAALVTGFSGEQKSLGVTVNSQNGLDHIEWSAGTLTANGGKIVENGPADYSVVLPEYQTNGVNSYTIRGVAIDKRGNVSSEAETQVTVSEAAVNATTSSLTPLQASLPADGHSQQTLTLNVRDSQGHAVDVNERDISLIKKSQMDNSDSQVTRFKRQSAGQYTATLTAGSRPETLTIEAKVRNIVLPAATVTITADNITPGLAGLTVLDDNSVANGTAQDRVKAIVTDVQGNPLAGQTVSFSADHNATITQSAVTNAQGEAVVAITDLKAGQSKVTARLGSESKEAEVNFVAGEATSVYVHRATGRAIADGVDTSRVEVDVTDANGNPVTGKKVVITASDNRINIPSEVTLNKYGTAKFDTTSSHDGGFPVKATVDGHSGSTTVYFYAGYPTANNSSFTASATSAPADGVSTITLTIVARDMRNNAVKNGGRLIGFDISGLPGTHISDVQVNGNIYTAHLTSTQPVSGTVSANLMLLRGVLPIKVAFTPVK